MPTTSWTQIDSDDQTSEAAEGGSGDPGSQDSRQDGEIH